MILVSTGASSMLIFAIPHSPVSQPWPLVGGHIISAFIGISAYNLIPNPILASSTVIGGSTVHELGYHFVIVLVFFNSIILLSIAMAVATFRVKKPFTE